MAETKIGPATPAKGENAPPHRKPIVGDDVWFYDQEMGAQYSRMGIGPYAAKVTAHDLSGVSLFVMGPQGGRFDVEKVLHKSDLPATSTGKQRWWEWPHGR